MSFEGWWELGSPVAHITGRAAIPGVALFLAGVAAALGAARFWGPPYTAVRRAMSVGLAAGAAGLLLLASVLPVLLH